MRKNKTNKTIKSTLITKKTILLKIILNSQKTSVNLGNFYMGD